jgi:predicted nucleic acid-binding protein
VAAELLAGVSVHPEIDRVLHVPWLEIRTLQNPPQPSEFLSSIDVGEAEAIRLAEEMNAEYLLIDDAAGRRMARLKNIPIIGLLGVLSEAKDAGLIPLLRPVYEKLADDLGFHASRHVIEAILEEHGE